MMNYRGNSPGADVSATYRGMSLLNRARAMSPLVAAEANSGEAMGRITPAVEAEFRDSGLFWMALPRAVGGQETDVLTMMDVLEELAFADGSTSWALMATACNTLAPAVFGSNELVAEMFGGAVLGVVAGQFGPGKGTITDAPGGYRFAGDFSFASGASAADWFTAGVAPLKNGKPQMLPNGYPLVTIAWFRRDQVEMRGNWSVLGLQGTGSIDYHIPEQFVPASHTMIWTANEPLRGGPMYRSGVRPYGLAGHSSVVLGIAGRALAESAAILTVKQRPGFSGPLIDHPVFRDEFSHSEARFQGARAYLRAIFGEVQDKLVAGGELTALDFQRMIQASSWAHEICSDVVRVAYNWAGTNAIRVPSALSRCMLDMQVATQHMIIDRIQFANGAGPIIEQWTDRLKTLELAGKNS